MMQKCPDWLDVSRETIEKLEAFERLVQKWTPKINLIAKADQREIWTRHILDSAQIFQYAPNDWKNWTDIGSGGGFPGVIMAILDTENRPITLVESDARKAAFLRTAERELSLNINVLADRIEHADVKPADVISARALTSLNDLIQLSLPLLNDQGVALFPKGKTFALEVETAQKEWNFDVDSFTSMTNADARVLRISRMSKRDSD